MNFQYKGSELELFSKATNWSNYIRHVLAPYIHGEVVEVGAGIGTRTLQLCNLSKRWIALEPDNKMYLVIQSLLAENNTIQNVELQCAKLADSNLINAPDTILYLDVLEHIEDDASELMLAANLLESGGKIIVIAPAHQYLYSDFDKSIEHYRRYNKLMLKNITPKNMVLEEFKMLDSAGLLASLGNKIFLKSPLPSMLQVKVWDSFLVKASRILDIFFNFKIGKTVFAIYTKY